MVKKDQSGNGDERRKKTQGRVKIEIKKIEKQSSRQVTFSKRKHGLFNKASQLCVLTGAEIAIIVQSLAGKRVFAFGHKSVVSVIDRFLHNQIHSEESTQGDYEKEEYYMVCQELDKAKKGVGDCGGGFWWEREVEELELAELGRYEAALVELMKNIDTKANLLTKTSSSSSSLEGARGFTGFNPYSNSSDDTLVVNNEMHQIGAAFEYYNYPNFTSF